MRYCGRTHVGKIRPKNEDMLHADGRLFAVADGMGGHRGGEVASSTAIRIVADAVRATPDDANAARLLAGAIVSANEEIYHKAHSGSGPAGMGTTLTAAILTDDRLLLGHVGDSRAYLLRSGELTQLTEDHSLVGELLRDGQLTKEQAFDHPNRNLLTKALGTSEDITADITTRKLEPGDGVLLTTDGLTTVVTDDQIAEILRGDGSVDEVCAKLIDAANRGGGPDNITVVLLDFSDADPFSARHAVGQNAKAPRKGCARVAALILVPLLLFGAIAGAGAYQVLRNTYYLGLSSEGRVAVFRGVPGSFLGLGYSEIYFETNLRRDSLAPASAKQVERNSVVGDLDMVREAFRNLERAEPTKPLPPGHPPVPQTPKPKTQYRTIGFS